MIWMTVSSHTRFQKSLPQVHFAKGTTCAFLFELSILMPAQSVLRPNAEDLPWVIQKYGGTSVGKFLDEISSNIVQ
jgi:hypothetical protein